VTPVNGDKVPMSPGFGQQPRFVVTIQPVGTLFNAPARITLPNVDGLAPRAVTEMYSYDHDLAAFVSIGTGTVSEDGALITSDDGVGVIKAGWHCGGNPNPVGSAGSCGDCQKCQGTSCVADAGQNGKLLANDKCKECKNGAAVPIPLNTIGNEVAFTFSPPNDVVSKVNTALEELKKVGVIASVNVLQIQGKLSDRECCNSDTGGKGSETSGSVSGNFGGFSIKAKLWPPGPIPSFGPKEIDVFGLASLTVKAEFVGGIFLGLTANVNGSVGYKKNNCSKDPADQAGCFFADLKTTLTPSLSAEIGGSGSLEFDCLFCVKTEISVSGSLLVGELTWPIDITGVSYNAASCSAGLAGGFFQFNPGSFKISATFSGSWKTEGGATKQVDVRFDFLSCDISTSGVECK
jgi:hypothetical protein